MRLTIDWDNRELYLKETKRRATPHMTLGVTISGITFRGLKLMFLLPDDKTATVSVNPVDARGFPAQVETLAYSSSDEAVVTIDQAGVMTPVGLGSAQINVTADAVIGEGVETIAGMLDVTVVAGQAVSLAVGATLS